MKSKVIIEPSMITMNHDVVLIVVVCCCASSVLYCMWFHIWYKIYCVSSSTVLCSQLPFIPAKKIIAEKGVKVRVKVYQIFETNETINETINKQSSQDRMNQSI